MAASTQTSIVETLPRSDSEIEVDFARHQNGDKVSPRRDPVPHPPPHRRLRRSFTTQDHVYSGSNSQEDTEGSSIVDLRTRGSNQRRSRSLNTLERERASRDGLPKDNARGTRRDHRSPLSLSHNYGFDQRMSFHSSLQDLSSDDQTKHRYQTPFRAEDFPRRPSRSRRSPEEGDSPSSENHRVKDSHWDLGKEENQVFMKKSFKYHEKYGRKVLPDTPPRSPTFSFSSSLSLLPYLERRKGLHQQILVTVSSSLAPLASGFAIAYVLTKNPQGLISADLAEWAHYIFILGAIIGAFFSGVVSNFGRKIPLFFCMAILMIGWVAIIFSTQAWMVLLFHGLSGGCCSLTVVLTQIYVAEIAVPSVRGALSSTPLLSLHIGLVLCFIMGNIFSWKNLAIAGVSLITPFFIMIVLCMPESPRFLIHKNPNEALAMLQWLRGYDSDIMEEYRDMADSCYADRWSLDKSDFAKPSFWRPLVISCTLMFLYSMSGIASIALYGQSLFLEMTLTYPNASYIIVASVSIVGIVISSLLVDQVGRKLLLLLSLTIMAAASFALGLFLFLKEIHKVETYFVYQWSAEVFCIVLFALAHGSAIGPIAWITLGEIFDTRLKWVGISLASMVMWSSLLLVDIAYHRISFVMATGGLFWFHCIICVGGYIFVLLFFRELRDHKMDEVGKVFSKKTSNLIDTFITKI